jgi:hypothetical protein
VISPAFTARWVCTSGWYRIYVNGVGYFVNFSDGGVSWGAVT